MIPIEDRYWIHVDYPIEYVIRDNVGVIDLYPINVSSISTDTFCMEYPASLIAIL